MIEWWNGIPAFEKVFWYFAIPFSLVFIIQLILTFMGMNDDTDVGEDHSIFDHSDAHDLDLDSGESLDSMSSFHFFTVRNFIIFFTVFGWTGIVGANSNLSGAATVILSVFLGLVVMAIVSGIFYLTNKLVENGTMSLANAMHCIGEVYITIPANGSGIGKVNITLQGSLREIEATTEGEEIKTGELIKVVGVVNNQILLVEKHSKSYAVEEEAY